MEESRFLSPAAAIVAEHVSRLSRELDLAKRQLQKSRESVESALAEAERSARAEECQERHPHSTPGELVLHAEKAELQELCLEYVSAKEQRDRLRSALEEMFGGGTWALLERAGKLHKRLCRQETITGRVWRLGFRILKKILRKSRRMIALTQSVARSSHTSRGLDSELASAATGEPVYCDAAATRTPTTFDELPWRIGKAPDLDRTARGHYKILLIAPGEDDAANLRDLLRLANRLARCDDFDCRIVLDAKVKSPRRSSGSFRLWRSRLYWDTESRGRTR